MESAREASKSAAQPGQPIRPIIGLTGGIGSGKSTVGNLFTAFGATVIDADAIAHELTVPGAMATQAIIEAFAADGVATAEGAIDRAKLRHAVFHSPEKRARLERILHPAIRAEIDRQAHQATGRYVVLMVPLLLEKPGWRERVEAVVVIDCPEETQIQRVMARSKLSRDEVLAIMATQLPRAERLAQADHVIDNSGSPESLRPQVERLDRIFSRNSTRHEMPGSPP